MPKRRRKEGRPVCRSEMQSVRSKQPESVSDLAYEIMAPGV